ncbi:MAG: selenocysteine-specific translation elongation factor [Candidatus Dormibacteraeota bacterium]|nr:selenocysteine-specific translation elongation factor [Candidatus Dormibacteraeota bacterium]
MSHIVGTAGHIDHGKSTLVKALTGIDPDRLAEEKRRGLTIDLGFAHLPLPSGRLAAIIDVPGHARLVPNMLAGAHGVDAALLVVAADEGVMPQTREHLEILDLLQVGRGVVALTKLDLVQEDWREMAEAQVAEALLATSLAGAPIVPVAARLGIGLAELTRQLDRVLSETPAKADQGRPRLPIDRAFTIGGFGSVVTGTLSGGLLHVGQEVELQPTQLRGRIRGLQQHNAAVDVAQPGSRVAVNVGGLPREALGRGRVLASPGILRPARRLDASVRVLKGAPRPLRHGDRLQLYLGTAEVSARAIVLGQDQVLPGGEGWLQLYLDRPVAALAGDRYVLRIPSPARTLAGGEVLDVTPRRHARLAPEVTASLARRAGGQALTEELAKYPRGIRIHDLIGSGLGGAAEVAALPARRAGDWLFSGGAWAALAERAGEALATYHRDHPLRAGMPREEFRSRLALPPAALGPVLSELARLNLLLESNGEVAAPGHSPQAAAETESAATRLLELLNRRPFTPPSLPEALQQSGASAEVARALIARGEVVRLSTDVVFSRQAVEAATTLVREMLREQDQVSVAAVRDRLGASRRPVLALLEHLDSRRITRRVGDARVLR